MNFDDWITLARDCQAIEIPSGKRATLPATTPVRVRQSRGNSYTVATDRGFMYRIDAGDADALGLSAAPAPPPSTHESGFTEEMVWNQLKTVYDPEIPVKIVDLGLIYACEITSLEDGARRIQIRMSMTAPGCGMGNVLKTDVEGKLLRLPSVKEVHVQVVFDPPWNLGRMSDAARLQLGL